MPRAHALGGRAPARGGCGVAEPSGDLREAVAGGPAHGGGERVDALRACGAPRARSLAGPRGACALAEALELLEEPTPGAVDQAPVEEAVRGGEHQAPVDVVLGLYEGLVPDAHGPHAAVAREGGASARRAAPRARCRRRAGGAHSGPATRFSI